MPEFNPQLDPATGWWVTGLTDGEGCFYAGLNFRERETSSGKFVGCVELEAQFAIALRADDRRTLDQIKQYFGCGAVNYKHSSKESPSAKRAGLKDPKPQYRFIVRRPQDLLQVVIPHFEAYPLRSKKSIDFELWSKLVTFAVAELVGKKGWLRRYPDKVQQLGLMCGALKENRKFVPQVVVGG